MHILRDELAYDGLVFSDDIEMRAMADHWSSHACSVGVLEAGVDSILVCSKADLRDAVLDHLEAAPDALLEAPLRRMAAFKSRFSGGRGAVVDGGGPPYADHVALAEDLRADTVALAGVDPTERA